MKSILIINEKNKIKIKDLRGHARNFVLAAKELQKQLDAVYLEEEANHITKLSKVNSFF